MSPWNVRCGRMDAHDSHEWTRPATLTVARTIYACNGHVISADAERAWAEAADKDEDDDAGLREWWRKGMSA